MTDTANHYRKMTFSLNFVDSLMKSNEVVDLSAYNCGMIKTLWTIYIQGDEFSISKLFGIDKRRTHKDLM